MSYVCSPNECIKKWKTWYSKHGISKIQQPELMFIHLLQLCYLPWINMICQVICLYEKYVLLFLSSPTWILSSWWFQPIWNMSNRIIFPRIGVKIETYLKPPPSCFAIWEGWGLTKTIQTTTSLGRKHRTTYFVKYSFLGEKKHVVNLNPRCFSGV